MPEKILLVSQEIAPYVPAEPMSELGRKLPPAVMAEKFAVRTVTPRFGCVNERRNQLHEVIRLSGVNIPIHDGDHPLIIKVASLQPSRIQAYFIDSDDYFQKEDSDTDYIGSNRPDNDERVMFFSRGASDMLGRLQWEPRAVQCSGWFTALMPYYLRRVYRGESGTPAPVYAYFVLPGGPEQPIPDDFFKLLEEDGVPAEQIEELKAMPRDVNMLHAFGIMNADAVIFEPSMDAPELRALAEKLGKPVSEIAIDDYDAKKYVDVYRQAGAEI